MAKSSIIIASAATILSQVKPIFNLSNTMTSSLAVFFVKLSVCFVTGSPSSLYDNTNPDWAPSQNIGHDKIKNTNLACERDARAKERSRKRQIEEEEEEVTVTVS